MNIYEKFQGKDSFSRHIDCFYKKKIHDIGIFLNDSKKCSERYKEASINVFHEKHEQHKGALLLPTTAQRIVATPIKEHVAYDVNLKPIFHANFIRPQRIGYTDHEMLPRSHKFEESIKNIRVIKDESIYLGTFLFHYGHFILESITRIRENLPFKDKKIKFVFHGQKNTNPKQIKKKILSGYWGEYFNALNIDIDSIIFIDEPTIFENITILSQSLVLSDRNCYISDEVKYSAKYINESMAAFYKGNRSNPPDKIYLSRAATANTKRQLVNELEVESFFIKKGFKIIRPEELDSEYEKHFFLSTAKVIAGVPGSGLLNTFFVPEGATVIALEYTDIPNMSLNQQIQIDFACGHITYIYFSNKRQDVEKGLKWTIDINDLENKLMSNESLSSLLS